MNKTVIYIGFIALIALSLIEALVLLWFAPEHFATFTAYIAVTLGVASTFAVTIWQLKQHRDETTAKLDVVQKQTNGTLTRLIEQSDAKTLIIHHKDSELRKRDAEIAELRLMAGLPPKAVMKGSDYE